MIGRLALGILLAGTPALALAGEWKVAAVFSGETRSLTFVDVQSVVHKGGKRRFRVQEYAERGPQGYDKVSATWQVDCSTFELVVIRSAYYRGAALMGFGAPAQLSNHRSAQALHHWTLRRVCEQRFLSHAVENPSRLYARALALEWGPSLSPPLLAAFLERPSADQHAQANVRSPASPKASNLR